MGTCVSLNRGSESAMKKKRRVWSKTEKLVMPSPVKDTAHALTVSDVLINNKSQASSARFSGSKDEAFFDSQPWLESDCEDDDFVSVNGDFTPSRGSTPVHHSFIYSPDKKKRRSQLFKESLGTEEEEEMERKDQSPPKSEVHVL